MAGQKEPTSRQKEPIYITENKPFPRALRELMKETDTTQPILAKAVGVTRQTISLYCTGQSTPDIDVFVKIADYFNVTYDFLLGKSEAKKRENVDINKRTGLSDEAINILEDLWNRKETLGPLTLTIDELIKNKSLIYKISVYLFSEMHIFTPEIIDVDYIQKDYDKTLYEDSDQFKLTDEMYKNILLVEIQNFLQKMRKVQYDKN